MPLNEKILVLLSTYNGEKYLKQQLDSLGNQTYKNIKVVARDDSSTDDTLKILYYPIKIIQQFGDSYSK